MCRCTTLKNVKNETGEILLHLTQQPLLNVNKISKQDMQNNIWCIIGVELNAQRSFFHTYLRTETRAPLINCVVNDALLETMSDIDQALLQFIDIVNLLDPLLHFSYISVVNLVQICAAGWQKVWCNERRRLVSEGWLSRTLIIIIIINIFKVA